MSVAISNHQAVRSTHSRLADLIESFQTIRDFTDQLCAPLEIEDMVVQSMPAASPTRWHLAHTTWFFETFLLKAFCPDYHPFHRQFEFLFNSYYNAVGEQFTQADRGLLTRPTVAQVIQYRDAVNRRVVDFLASADPAQTEAVADIVQLGLQHEQQHQELILTDLKHLFSRNPLAPAYASARRVPEPQTDLPPLTYVAHEEQLAWIGHQGAGFAFDNELPRHRQFVESFAIANRLITNGEFLQFIEAGGYSAPEHWLSLGWETVTKQGWQAPLYWTQRDGIWCEFTLFGLHPIDRDAPVCHVSYFEADAYARFSGARLPTEAEWEIAANRCPLEGNFSDSRRLHPGKATDEYPITQMFGDCWQWTSSPYVGYPGYRPPAGAVGEYNGKFMCNQYVLRGGSIATSRSHIRPTYRNFFSPESRWQFSGIRTIQR